MRLLGACLILATLTACGGGMSDAEKARREARDVAFVEAAQKRRPPAQPILPQPLWTADLSRLPPGGTACRLLLRDRAVDAPVLTAGRVTAHLKIENRLVTLAADTGGAKLAAGVYRKYVGKAFWLELGESDNAPHRPMGWIMIHDRFDRTVFMAAGEWDCPRAPVRRPAGR